jgi:SAM-dependent methyltransferase
MLDADEHHWWYRARRRLIDSEVERLRLPSGARILDAGCGSGSNMPVLEAYGDVAGVDGSPLAVAAAVDRGRNVVLGRVERLPHPGESFDLVTCLDVLEHTLDDRAVLAELRRVTRPGGHLLVTVPAYRALWSAHDVANEHQRRYGRTELRAAAGAAGWRVVRDTHFNALVLGPAALVRLTVARPGRHARAGGRSDLARTPRVLDGVLERIVSAEQTILRHGRTLPAGLSILAVMRREPDPAEIRKRPPAPPRPRRVVESIV